MTDVLPSPGKHSPPSSSAPERHTVTFDPALHTHSGTPPPTSTPAWRAVTFDLSHPGTPATTPARPTHAHTEPQPPTSIPAWHTMTFDLAASQTGRPSITPASVPTSAPSSSAPASASHSSPSSTAPGSSHSTHTGTVPRTPHCFYGQVPQYSAVPTNWPRVNPEIWTKELSPLTQTCLRIYDVVRDTALPNFVGARIPVPSGLNIPAWRELTQEINYPDKQISDFLEFGFPLGYQADFYPDSDFKQNHFSALQYPEAIQSFIDTELAAQAVIGPFTTPCFTPGPKISPLMTRPKNDSNER